MHGVLQLKGRGLMYQTPVKDLLTLHQLNPYIPNFFTNSQQVSLHKK